MRELWIRIVEIGLRVAALLSVVLAVLWAMGPNGLNEVGLHLFSGLNPSTLLASETLSGWSQPPQVGVELIRMADHAVLYDAMVGLGAIESGPAPAGHAGITLSVGLQLYDPTWAQLVAWSSVNVLISLAIAWMWWMLANLVRSARSESPFTARNARRLTRVGWLLLAGGLAASVAKWATLTWIVETSSMSDRVEPFSYGFTDIPWGTLAVGAAVLVLAAVWRRGVAMADDLEGLV